MTGLLAATAAVLLAQGPMCGGQYDLRPDDTALLLTGCFIPSVDILPALKGGDSFSDQAA